MGMLKELVEKIFGDEEGESLMEKLRNISGCTEEEYLAGEECD